jgi:hypothetical protein
MDELALLREFRAAVPGPSEAALERALAFRHRRRRRSVVVAAVVVAAVVLVTSAFAFGLLPGSPAPKSVKKQISLLLRVPRGEILALQQPPPGPRMLVDKARLLASISTSQGRFVVWVLPLTDGSRCAFLQRVGERNLATFGCSGGSLFPTTAGFDSVHVIGGFAPPRARTVELKGAVGWGNKTLPVHHGFYFGRFDSPIVREATARDAQGHVLARSHPYRPEPPPERPIVPTDRTALEIRTRKGYKVSLIVGPGQGGTCVTWSTYGPGDGQASCGPFVKHGLRASIGQFGVPPNRMVFVQGETGPRIREVRLRFEDGKTVPVKFGLRVFLYEVPPRNYVKGHRPQLVLGLDRKRHVLARQRLGPYAG